MIPMVVAGRWRVRDTSLVPVVAGRNCDGRRRRTNRE